MTDQLLQEIISDSIDFTNTPQVISLTNLIKNRLDMSKLFWLDKTDGVRHVVINYKGNVYKYHPKFGLTKLYTSKVHQTSIVDAEELDSKFYIFDVYYLDKDVRKFDYKSRMGLLDKAVNKYFGPNKLLILKTFKKVTNWKDLITYARTIHEHKDGVIIQLNEPYSDNWIRDCQQFKLKPAEFNTVDILYKQFKPNVYHLYLIGNAKDILNNQRSKPRYVTDFGYNLKKLDFNKRDYLILFESPFFKKISEYIYNKSDMTKLGISHLEDEGIYESYLDENCVWHPIRHRDDKKIPNGYIVGLNNVSLVFSPVTDDDNYFQAITFDQVKKNFNLKSIDAAKELVSEFHDISNEIRSIIFKHVNIKIDQSINQAFTCLDLAGGRGGDLEHIFNLGFRNIFAEDIDKEALTLYSIKARSKRVLLNCFGSGIEKDNSALIQDIIHRHEYKPFKFVVLNYAVHYLIPNIESLYSFLKSVCDRDVKILMTYYDGEKIKEYSKKSKEVFKIKVKGSTAEMPLPTISKTGYRSEPLVLKDSFEGFFKPEFEYYPYKECKQKSKYCPEYLSCIKSGIYTLN